MDEAGESGEGANAAPAGAGDAACLYCGYSLTGIADDRCPECGVERPKFRLESAAFRCVCIINSSVFVMIYLLLFCWLFDLYQYAVWYNEEMVGELLFMAVYAGVGFACCSMLGLYAVMHESKPRPIPRSVRRRRRMVNLAPVLGLFVLGAIFVCLHYKQVRWR